MDEHEEPEQKPRGGSPVGGAARPDRPVPPNRSASSDPETLQLLKRFDDAFSRTFMAMAMAEDGTRELALEQLDGIYHDSEAPEAPKDPAT